MKEDKKKIFRQKAKKIRYVILDVDGVMTDGTFFYDADGVEHKSFFVRDGSAVRMALRAGIEIIIISGKRSPDVEIRGAELGVKHIYQKVINKGAFLDDFFKKNECAPESVAAMGDDLLDLQIFRRVGLQATVADAVQEVKDAALYITAKPGGRGAVREFLEELLKIQGKWQEVTARYYEKN